MDYELTIIVDSKVDRSTNVWRNTMDLREDEGLSVLLKARYRQFLFGFGNDPEIFAHNVETLGINLEDVDYALIPCYEKEVLGGLWYFLEHNEKAKIIGTFDYRGWDLNREIKEKYGKEVWASGFSAYMDSPGNRVHSTGSIWRSPRPEHALYIQSVKGLIVISACSFAGPANVADFVESMNYSNKLYMYIGSVVPKMYYYTEDDIREMIEQLKEKKVKKVAPLFKTDDKTRRMLKEVYKDNYIDLGVGSVIGWY